MDKAKLNQIEREWLSESLVKREQSHSHIRAKCQYMYTDKKDNKIFLIYKEIQKGAVAKWKSYMTNGLLIFG